MSLVLILYRCVLDNLCGCKQSQIVCHGCGSECAKCSKPFSRNQKKGYMCSVCEKRTQEEAINNVTLVQNELLAYAVFYLQSCTYENVEKAVLDTFDPDDVTEAKHILWEYYKEILHKWEIRNNSQGKEKKEKQTEDVLRNLIKLDHAGQYNKVKFACLNFGALPKSIPNELDVVSLFDRENDLESAKKSMTNMMLRHDSEISDIRNKLEMLIDIHLQQGSYSAVCGNLRDNTRQHPPQVHTLRLPIYLPILLLHLLKLSIARWRHSTG